MTIRSQLLASTYTPHSTVQKLWFKPPTLVNPITLDLGACNIATNGSFTVTGGTSSPDVNKINEVTVAGVNILPTCINHTGDNTTTAAAIAAAIAKKCHNASFTVSGGSAGNTIDNINFGLYNILNSAVTHTGDNTTTAAAIAARINEGFKIGRFRVAGGSAGSKKITAITVDGVAITNGSDINHTGSATTTAAAVAAAINAHTSSPDFTAVSIEETVYIRGASGAGAGVLSITTSGGFEILYQRDVLERGYSAVVNGAQVKIRFPITGADKGLDLEVLTTPSTGLISSVTDPVQIAHFSATNSGAVVNIVGSLGTGAVVAVNSAGDVTTGTLVDMVADLTAFQTYVQSRGYTYTSGDAILVPAGLTTHASWNAATVFGVSGLTVNSLAINDDVITTAESAANKFVFVPKTVLETDQIAPTKDVLIKPWTCVRTGFNCKGGRHHHWLGGDFTVDQDARLSPTTYRAAVKSTNQSGIATYEGLYINLKGGELDGQFFGWDGLEYGCDAEVDFLGRYAILNCLADRPYSDVSHPAFGSLHADGAQDYGKSLWVFIDGFTVIARYTGVVFEAQHWMYDRNYRRMNLRYDVPAPAERGLMYYMRLADNAYNFGNDIWPDFYFLDHVYGHRRPDAYGSTYTSFATASFSPGLGGQAIPAKEAADSLTGKNMVYYEPEARMYGNVHEGSTNYGGAIFGDYVRRGYNCGASYVSPGYEDTYDAFYELDDVQLLWNFEHWYVYNTRALGAVNVNNIYDISDKWYDTVDPFDAITFPAHGPTTTLHMRACRNVLFFDGVDDWATTERGQLGDTLLFAGPLDEFSIYLTAGATQGTIFAKGDQLRLHVSDGDLYGVCRGASTLIMADFDVLCAAEDSLPTISVHWDRTTLLYIVNTDMVTGNVGTDAENGADIEIGRNVNTNYGTVYFGELRIKDVVDTPTKRAQMLAKYRQKWNQDGRYPNLPTTPSGVTNLQAVESGANCAMTWTAPADLAGSIAVRYIKEYRLASGTDDDYVVFPSSLTVAGLTTVATSFNEPLTTFTVGQQYLIRIRPMTIGGYGTPQTVTFTRS